MINTLDFLNYHEFPQIRIDIGGWYLFYTFFIHELDYNDIHDNTKVKGLLSSMHRISNFNKYFLSHRFIIETLILLYELEVLQVRLPSHFMERLVYLAA